MPRSTPSPHRGPMIHVRLDEKTHRNLKMIVATRGTTIQRLVSEIIEKAVSEAKE